MQNDHVFTKSQNTKIRLRDSIFILVDSSLSLNDPKTNATMCKNPSKNIRTSSANPRLLLASLESFHNEENKGLPSYQSILSTGIFVIVFLCMVELTFRQFFIAIQVCVFFFLFSSALDSVVTHALLLLSFWFVGFSSVVGR